jgi:hypothetical protein
MRGGFGGGFRGGNGFGGFHGAPIRNNFGFRNFNRFGSFSRFGFGFGFPAFYGGSGFYDWPAGYSYPYDNSYPYDYGYSNTGYQYAEPEVIVVQQSPNVYSYVQPADYAPAAPVVREYVSPPPSQASSEPPLYLIAFQDGSIRAALAYWAEGSAVHYITLDHEQKQAPLASIDRALSDRLNRERNVPFRLPAR